METPSPAQWNDRGELTSRLYGDVYFSREDGLAEARAVFLAGCGLPEAWRGRTAFTVAELGFGTGLNIAALLMLWREHRPPGGQLHIFSIEAHPLGAADAARALSRWPELEPVTAPLIARWPGQAAGFHRLDLPEFDAILDLAVMEAGEALAAWTGAADAWFLDGFAPSANPAMWREEVLGRIAARSAPGARAATFTVAGEVRRGLAHAGFTVEKHPGFGRKRERLEASLPGGRPASEPAPPSVAILGAGVAGASLARAFARLDVQPQLIDRTGPAAGASGNPAALVTPRLDAGLGPPAQLFAQAFGHAIGLYRRMEGVVLAEGVLQLAVAERDPRRFAKIAACDLFEPGALRLLTAEETSARLGEPAPEGLDIAAALTIDGPAAIARWARPEAGFATAVAFADGRWRVLGEDGEALAEADILCLAAGLASADLWPGMPLAPLRGQAEWSLGPTAPAVAFGPYAAPMPGGVLFGATHDRGQTGVEIRPADRARNLAALAERLPALAERLAAAPGASRAAIRAVTPDRLPLAGAAAGAPAGLFLLTGLGARGFCAAPLLAEHVAALALGRPSPLPRTLAEAVAPARFALPQAQASP